jgi:hypothetical protein
MRAAKITPPCSELRTPVVYILCYGTVMRNMITFDLTSVQSKDNYCVVNKIGSSEIES